MSDELLQVVLREHVPTPAGAAGLLARCDTPRASPDPDCLISPSGSLVLDDPLYESG